MIRHVAHRTAVESVERQNVDLWIDAQGPWSKALTPLGMAVLTQDERSPMRACLRAVWHRLRLLWNCRHTLT